MQLVQSRVAYGAASDGIRNLKLCVPMNNYWAESGQRQYRVIVSLYYSWLKHCGNYTLMTSLSDQLTTTITHLITACLCALWSCPQLTICSKFCLLFCRSVFFVSIIFQNKSLLYLLTEPWNRILGIYTLFWF